MGTAQKRLGGIKILVAAWSHVGQATSFFGLIISLRGPASWNSFLVFCLTALRQAVLLLVFL